MAAIRWEWLVILIVELYVKGDVSLSTNECLFITGEPLPPMRNVSKKVKRGLRATLPDDLSQGGATC